MNDINWKKKIVYFLTAQTISLFGSSIVQYAIIWYITLTTSSGSMMTLSTICGYVPQIAISLFAGVWIDRYDKKKIMMISDGVIAVSTLVIAILFLCGYKSIWLLFAVLIVRSAGTGIQAPSVNAFIPQIVPKEYLMKVNGINSTLTAFMAFLSPAASGAVLSIISLEATFFIDVITAVIGIGIMFLLKIEKNSLTCEETQTVEVVQDIKNGFSYLMKNQFIKHQIIYIIVVAILISPSAFLTPLLVSRTFGPQVWKLTLSEMVFSLGASAGGVLIAVWGGFSSRRHTLLLATACYGVMMVGIGSSNIYLVYLFFNFLIGITMPCYNAPAAVLLQENVEPKMYGRVFSLVQIANAGALPLGTLIFGPLADIVPVQIILIFGGMAVVLFTCYSWKSKIFFKA